MSSRLGIDVGGTFTDFLLFDERSGAMRLLKTPSTPSDQSVGILNGIQQLIESLPGEQAQFAFHKLEGAASEEDLQSLLDDLERLKALEELGNDSESK